MKTTNGRNMVDQEDGMTQIMLEVGNGGMSTNEYIAHFSVSPFLDYEIINLKPNQTLEQRLH